MIDSLHKYPVFPDLLENQKRSLQYFWKKGILEELELFSYLSRSNNEDFDESSSNGHRLFGNLGTKAFPKRKNQTPSFSFLSRGVTSLHAKSVFQFQNKNQTQKRTTSPIVFFNQLYPSQVKESQLFSFAEKRNLRPKNLKTNFSSSKSRSHTLRPLKFSFGSSGFQNEVFEKNSTIFEEKDTYFKPEFFQSKDDSDSGKDSKIIIHGSKFLLKTPQYSKQQAIRAQKTYSVGLYIPVEFVENLGSSKLGLDNHEELDFGKNPGESRSLFQTKGNISIKNSENSNVFAFSNVRDPKDRFAFLGTSSFIFESQKKNENNPRHVVGGLGIDLLVEKPRFSNQQINACKGIDLLVEKPRFSNQQINACKGIDLVTKLPKHSQIDLKNQRNFSNQDFMSLTQHTPPSTLFEQNTLKRKQFDQNVKPRWFYFGDIPLMTERGSFLINGAPRVLVNQIIRCPSVYFKLKLDSKNRRSFIASFLSEYGSWLRLETDRLRSRIWVRIDKSPRFPLDWLLSALGWSADQQSFENSAEIMEERESTKTISKLLSKTPQNGQNGNSSLIGGGEKFGKIESTHQEATQLIWKKCNPSRWTSFIGCYSFFYTKFFHPRRYSLGNLGRLSLNKRLGRRRDCEIPTLTPEDIFLALDYLIQLQTGNESGKFYLDDIDHLKNRRVRLPGEIIQNQFRLALSRLSGVILSSLNSRTKTQSIGSETEFPPQRLESSKALLQNQALPNLKIGQMSESAIQGSTIAQIFGGSPPQSFVSTLRELFNTSQLSQYMDQTNPLAEITHKRRLTSLGPGGVGRDQAGFAVREIHPSHFGRICPIETPEGQNAGLVGSLASYARINADGFLQSPAMSLFSSTSALPRHGLVFKQIEKKPIRECFRSRASKPIYLFSAEAEDEIYLCTADIGAVTAGSRIRSFELTQTHSKNQPIQKDEPVPIRFKQEFIATSGKKIQYTGICPIQMISVATSLIPFLEHDDANRALMGSNMQRQAVPLIFPEKAFVGTGLEMQAARDSSTPLISSVSGQVHFVDARRIEIRHESHQSKSFDLLTYARSNQSTSIHHRPAVQLNEWIEKGDILADGSATHDGELSLGKNLLLAYMPWEGYNFEDAIVINERLVYEDVYTSLHVERYEVDIRNAQPLRLGSEVQKNSKFTLENNKEGIDLVTKFPTHSQISIPLSVTKDQSSPDFSEELVSKQSFESIPELGGELPTISSEEIDFKTELANQGSEVLIERIDQATKPQNNSKQNLTMMEIGKEYITRDLDLVFGGRPASRSSDLLTDQSGDLLGNSPILGEPARVDSLTKTGSQDGSPPESRNFSSQICNLDSEGIIQPGTWVKEGDILVGKITPTQRTKISSGQSPPEYRLLVAIFADGASKIESSFNIRLKNTSFKAGIGVKGRVIDCIIPWRPTNGISGSDSLSLSRSPNRQIRKSAPIQIFLAHKKRIQLGDKMSGRHGNKGIVSLILPPHDMPYTQDGKPIDVVLNPLGVPSRMNVGQVLESLLGLVSAASHQIYRLMPFDEMYGGNVSAMLSKQSFETNSPSSSSGTDAKLQKLGAKSPSTEDDSKINLLNETISPSQSQKTNESLSRPETSRSIVYSKLQTTRNLLGKAAEWYFDPNNPGKTQIFDGRTGEVFHQPALVGHSYMFKLIHLVDDKIHARSTGPYSLVTQQPLGGRSKKGGQRLGEMEVWALEGFGAAYILQEFLTVKSDEIYSRNTFLLDLMKRKTEESKASLIPMTPQFRSEENANLSSIGEVETTQSLLQSLENKLGIFKTSDKIKKEDGLTFDLHDPSRVGKKLTPTNESRVPESFRVLVNELQALCLSVYYNPDFRLSYPSLLGWDGVFLLASKKFPTSPELSQIKNIGF